MKKIILLAFINFLGIIIFIGCASAVRYDGPYEGRVIDADTGQPIEGVVVLGVWNKEYPTPGGAVHEFYDARETVTDKNGEFSIPGMGLEILSNVTPMDVLIFKTGYRYLESTWRGLKVDILLSKKIKWEGNKAIIPLKKLTMEERKTQLFGKENIPDEKQKLLIRELNKERIEIGLTPYQEFR